MASALPNCCLSTYGNTSLLACNICIVLRYLVPIHNIPPVRYILRPTILVLEVVSMLPNIKTKNREHDFIGNSLHQWVVLVRCSNELQSITTSADPHPSTTKECSRCCPSLECGLHLLKGTKGLVNSSLKLCTWLGFLGL